MFKPWGAKQMDQGIDAENNSGAYNAVPQRIDERLLSVRLQVSRRGGCHASR
jgi:hypothetical protein